MSKLDWKAEAEQFLGQLHFAGLSTKGCLIAKFQEIYKRGQRESGDTVLLTWLETNRRTMRKRV
jgi:hypothetical protein